MELLSEALNQHYAPNQVAVCRGIELTMLVPLDFVQSEKEYEDITDRVLYDWLQYPPTKCHDETSCSHVVHINNVLQASSLNLFSEFRLSSE